ncbi:MAG: MFS transporter [Spongiibacteraceae bacterium]
MSNSRNAIAEWRSFWFLPLAAALGYATSVIHVYSLGPFIQPLQETFGWSRAQISVGLTVQCIVSAIFCIPIGMVIDRIGPRRVALVGVLTMSGAFALVGTATGTTGNWLLLWIGIALGGLGVQAPIWTSAVATRFEVSRGLAFAVTLCGASVAAAIFPVLATWLIDLYGWRQAFSVLGMVWAACVFPLLFLFFRSARDRSVKPAETAVAAPARALTGVTLAEGLRSPTLYKLLLAGGLVAFTVIGAMVHFVPILKGAGASPLAAAGVASLIGLFSIVGRLGTGFLLDRFPGHIVGGTVVLLPIIAALMLLFDGANPVSQMIAAAALGFTVGSEVDVVAFLASKHFGLKNFGALYGALVAALTLGTAFGPLTAGAVFDHFGNYEQFLWGTIVLMLLGALALFSLGHPPKLEEAAPVVE